LLFLLETNMDTQLQGESDVMRLQEFLGRLAGVMSDAKSHVEQPLDPGHWDDDNWIDAETVNDRAFLVLDDLLGELVAACLSVCDGSHMTPADFAEYVQVMARAQQKDMPMLSPTTLKVLNCVASYEEQAADDVPQTPAAAAQLAQLQWMMQLPEDDYLAALEARSDDGQPRIMWAIHPDNWDFERNCPKAQNGGSNGTGNGAA
jgi:hypothetical protein